MDMPVAIGEVVASKYRIDRFIGAGGMGVVVAAFHLELEQPVAIKFLNAETGARADGAERFRREARAAARIHSEHVARVLDVGVLSDRIPYIVMDLLEGNDLEHELEAHGPLPVPVAVEYVLQAIDAIAEAHAAGIVHRDLKPTNLFLARRPDGARIVKVLDFGISKLLGPGWGRDAALTRSASMFGSPLYMSPEQMRSAKDVDARADIWSLGAILYELVTGQPPFVADSIPSLCLAVLTDAPRPLRDLAPSAPIALEAVLARCLVRDANARFESVAQLAQALVPFAPTAWPHAERAQRLLWPPAASLADTPSAARQIEASAMVASRGSTPAASEVGGMFPSTPGATQASWGKTGRRPMVNRRVGTVLAGLLALVFGAVLIARQVGDRADAVGRIQTSLHSATAVSPNPVSDVTRDAEAPIPSGHTEVPPVAEAKGGVQVAPVEASGVGSASPKPALAGPKPGGNRAVPRSNGSTARDKGSSESASLSDFGGRIY